MITKHEKVLNLIWNQGDVYQNYSDVPATLMGGGEKKSANAKCWGGTHIHCWWQTKLEKPLYKKVCLA